MLQIAARIFAEKVAALAARVRMLKGEKLKFDDELARSFTTLLRQPTASPARTRIRTSTKSSFSWKRKFPAAAPVAALTRWRKPFVIPKEKLIPCFKLAIKNDAPGRWHTLRFRPNESFTVEYVTNKPWAVKLYKGDFHSGFRKYDLPLHRSRFDLAAHEGYPGHHVYNSCWK